MHELYTIGHSTHSLEQFLALLKMHQITAVGDVRSDPYSRFNPQFNREPFQRELKQNGVAYVYLGRELGPRSDDPECFRNGKVSYELLAKTDLFQEGLKRIRQGMRTYRISLMCSEKDPIACHRTILVCRHLRDPNVCIRHILDDGALEENDAALARLKELLKLPERDLFTSSEEMTERAYTLQGGKIAYAPKRDNGSRENEREGA